MRGGKQPQTKIKSSSAQRLFSTSPTTTYKGSQNANQSGQGLGFQEGTSPDLQASLSLFRTSTAAGRVTPLRTRNQTDGPLLQSSSMHARARRNAQSGTRRRPVAFSHERRECVEASRHAQDVLQQQGGDGQSSGSPNHAARDQTRPGTACRMRRANRAGTQSGGSSVACEGGCMVPCGARPATCRGGDPCRALRMLRYICCAWPRPTKRRQHAQRRGGWRYKRRRR